MQAGNNWINATASQLLDETWEGVTFNGRQARKQFLQRLAAAGVKHPDDYLGGKTMPLPLMSFASTFSTELVFSPLCPASQRA
jgi:hypothetical protein